MRDLRRAQAAGRRRAVSTTRGVGDASRRLRVLQVARWFDEERVEARCEARDVPGRGARHAPAPRRSSGHGVRTAAVLGRGQRALAHGGRVADAGRAVVTPGDAAVCGAWQRDADPCDAPAGLDTSHPGYGRCLTHYGETPRGRAHAATKEAIAVSTRVAGLIGFSARGGILCEVRVLAGAVEYCHLRVAQPSDAGADWIAARYTLVKRLSRLRKKAARSGVSVFAAREITAERLRPHLPPASLRPLAAPELEQARVVRTKSPSSAFIAAVLAALGTGNPRDEDVPHD